MKCPKCRDKYFLKMYKDRVNRKYFIKCNRCGHVSKKSKNRLEVFSSMEEVKGSE